MSVLPGSAVPLASAFFFEGNPTMIRGLVHWALNNPLIVILVSVVLSAFGMHAFLNINVEAYPDPAPAIVEVVAQWPGASAEEMERQVTIPLEITLAGMPGLKTTLTKSLYGLSHLRNVFEYGHDYDKARQEVINRLQFTQSLPAGVQPVLSPASPIGEIFRYTIRGPKNALGQDIYTLNDLKALQDWYLEREFRRVPGVIDVTSAGGTVKRYEIQPDPERLKRYAISLSQLQNALSNSNANTGGDILIRGKTILMVRGVGVLGGGKDPMEKIFAMPGAEKAGALLRAEDQKRVDEIRNIVITSINNVPIRIDDIVKGGPGIGRQHSEPEGVVVGYQTRLGRVSLDRALDPAGQEWERHDEKVQAIILMRKNEQSLPTLKGVKEKFAELSKPGKLPPGVELEAYYDRTELVGLTTHTVRHNLAVGIGLVTVILLMFLSNVRSAVIVAINIPLALLFAFTVLYWRGKSANLLSIGAVDFGIIVDSSVIMVENVYRHLCAGEHKELPLKERVFKACCEIDKALFFSTTIMVVAFVPLFTMSGAEGELFGPMAQTYAFALAGALLMALTLTPVMCVLFYGNVKPKPDNFLVRFLKHGYLRNLRWCLNNRITALSLMTGLLVLTLLVPIRNMGREFMPELEEGNLWIRAIFPVHVSLDAASERCKQAREIMGSERYPEVQSIVTQAGRPDDGTDPGGFNNVEFFVPMRPEHDWPVIDRPNGERKRRTRPEIVEDMNAELKGKIPGIEWGFSQYIRDNVMEAISGVKGDNSVKIYGPDLEKLEELAEKTKKIIADVPGVADAGIFHIMGQANLEFAVDKDKCKLWGAQVADVNNVISTALRGNPLTQMVEGAKLFDVTLRWPQYRREDLTSILDIPVDITNNSLMAGSIPNASATTTTGPASAPSPTGTGNPPPSQVSQFVSPSTSFLPRVPLRYLVSPVGPDGRPDPNSKDFIRPGGSIIPREQGKRFIAVKFSIRDRDLAGTVEDVKIALQNAKEKIDGEEEPLFRPPYWYVMGGEFEQMGDAESRLLLIVPASLIGIFILLYFAFRSMLDAVVVMSNVFYSSIGGFWALWFFNVNFSVSAAVGFVSLFGVAIMDGLLLIAYFNDLRARGHSVNTAIMEGAALRVRPVMITALTAILGLLPAAFSKEIGAQTQAPLSIVVVFGMLTALFLTRYLMPLLYSFYGHREPPEGSSSMAH
jgi:cobalt-zinc-cadmium resistance protein CzcA